MIHVERTRLAVMLFLSFLLVGSCTQGSLRLIGGFKQTEGTLEVCNNGSWNIICADQFQRQDGFVACRQLGYPATGT